MVQEQRMINAMALRVLCFKIGFKGLMLGEDSLVVCLSSGLFIRLFDEQAFHLINN